MRWLPWNRKMERLQQQIEELRLYVGDLYHEEQEISVANQRKLDELELYAQRLFHEKHEMILEDRKKIDELELYAQRLFHEKHEMILEDKKKIGELELYAQRLFHEKHEMILEDRKEIQELVRKDLLRFYAGKEFGDKAEAIEFLKSNPLQMYPYSWTKEYEKMPVECFREDEWLYVLHKGKKCFFPLKYTEEQAKEYYRFLVMEQDKQSPHFYGIRENFMSGTTFVDVGAAEGIISLEVVDKADKLYLFECDADWVEALRKTFAGYEDKVRIIEKFVGDETIDSKVRLYDVLREKGPYVIKIDVEGHEAEVLRGMRGMKMEKGSCILICCYHHQEDEEFITDYMKKQEMSYSFADGYMLSTWGGYREPYFRRGICRAYCDSGSKILK